MEGGDYTDKARLFTLVVGLAQKKKKRHNIY